MHFWCDPPFETFYYEEDPLGTSLDNMTASKEHASKLTTLDFFKPHIRPTTTIVNAFRSLVC